MPDIIVIGAGFAGLSAAAALAERGARVLVLEARPRLGGRASSYRDPTTGQPVDNGQHVLFGCYRETWRFLRRIGADGGVRLANTLAVESIDVDNVHTRLECPPLPPPLHLLAGVLDWGRIPASERWSALGMLGAVRAARAGVAAGGPPHGARDDETVRDWLVRHRQGPQLRRLLWEPLALAALNQRPEHAAAPTFARVLAELCGPHRRDAAVGVPAVPLEALYAEPARRFVERRGGRVETRTPAVVHVEGGRVRGVEAGGGRIAAGAVIAAVPWHALPRLLPDAPDALGPLLQAARDTAGSPIVTINLWVDRPLLPTPWLGLPGRTMQWAFETTPGRGSAGARLALVASGADDVLRLPNRRLVRRAAAELRDALPGGWRIEHASVVREPQATFSLAPGQPPRPGTRTPVDGLLLAGDWVDTGLPATIESAAVSGHRAADEAAAVARLGGE